MPSGGSNCGLKTDMAMNDPGTVLSFSEIAYAAGPLEVRLDTDYGTTLLIDPSFQLIDFVSQNAVIAVSSGDGDGYGDIDLADFLALQDCFGGVGIP